MTAADSLADGTAGIALLHIERARTGAASWDTAHQWALAMTRSPVTAHPDLAGLYRGAPAVAFALHTADVASYATVLDTLDGHISALTRYRLRRAHERIDTGQLPALREFDLISGLTGLGVYLLHRGRHPDLLHDVLTYLVRLTEPVRAEGETVPGWWCRDSSIDLPARQWPGGHGNLGIAHGIAGPLALMATATRCGVTVNGLTDAIDRISHWLIRWQAGTRNQAWWPGRITRSELHSGTVQQPGPQRPSWCYGTPGLARALQLAALATNDPRRQRQAEQALAGCAADEQQLAQLTDATLCHGWAGLIHTTRRVAADANNGELHDALPRLTARLEQHLHRHGPPDRDGLLEGRAGVRLVQHTGVADQPSTTDWDACLLLTGSAHPGTIGHTHHTRDGRNR